MARNYAAVPYEYLEEMEELTDEEFGRLIRALIRYSMSGEEVKGVGNERFFRHRVMIRENSFRDSYEDLSQIRREAGKKGAEKRWQNGKAILPLANDSKNTKDKDKVKVKVNPSPPADAGMKKELLWLEGWAAEHGLGKSET